MEASYTPCSVYDTNVAFSGISRVFFNGVLVLVRASVGRRNEFKTMDCIKLKVDVGVC